MTNTTRRRTAYSRASLPLGTVRVRTHNGKPTRFIKVSMDGRPQDRWTEFARHWWEANRGPVPAGKRVCHEDGDTLNDDPSNLVLLTPGDVVFLAHERDPRMSRRNRVACGKATAAANRERAVCRRLREWLPSKWYPVDLANRVIHNVPVRKRWEAYRAADPSLAAVGPSNGKGLDAAALGWPSLGLYGACILTVLVGAGGWLTTDDLLAKLRELRTSRGWGPVLLPTLYSEMSKLGRDGLVLVERRGRLGNRYHAARAAIDGRGSVCSVLPVRGSDLADDRYAGFARLDPLVHTAANGTTSLGVAA